jgi:hypothetical protein
VVSRDPQVPDADHLTRDRRAPPRHERDTHVRVRDERGDYFLRRDRDRRLIVHLREWREGSVDIEEDDQR